MRMSDYINSFPDQLRDALRIGNEKTASKSNKNITHVLICGLGGSGIGGTIISDILSLSATIPISTNKDYSVPNFVNRNTLVIANSYSGNTEETLSALKKCQEKGAEIAIITSGGKLENIAQKHNYTNIIVPAGHPPRAMFGYAFIELFFILYLYNIIDSSFKIDFKNAIQLIEKEQKNIQREALELAKKLSASTPIIYVANGFEGVAIRFRQQINENSKMLCWHHVIPEMNHNELLGWRTNTENLSVVYFRNKSDYKRNQVRIDINKDVISKYTTNITEVWSKGNSLIENTLYHINLGDWASWYLSEINNVDAIEINILNYLKKKLSKI